MTGANSFEKNTRKKNTVFLVIIVQSYKKWEHLNDSNERKGFMSRHYEVLKIILTEQTKVLKISITFFLSMLNNEWYRLYLIIPNLYLIYT